MAAQKTPLRSPSPARRADRAMAGSGSPGDPGATLGRFGPAALAVLAAALYARTIGNGLTNWDDPAYVQGSPFATRGLAGIPAAWTTGHEDAYYPLTHTLYCVIQEFAGPSALVHHLVQVVIFAAAVALVPAALRAFRVPQALALAAAVLWAVHPLRVESVSWVANLKDTLSVALVLGAFALYGTGRRRSPKGEARQDGRFSREARVRPSSGPSAGAIDRRAFRSAIVFTLAMLAKSTVFPIAGVFFLLAWREGKTIRQAALASLPYLVPAVAVAILGAALHLGGHPRTPVGGSLLGAIPSALWLPWWYLGRTLLPLPSLAIYPFDPVRWTDLRLLVAAFLWGGLAVFVLRGRLAGLRDRVLAVGAWWLPGAAVTGLVPLSFPVADRYSLLPSLAAIAAILLVAREAAGARRWLVPVGAGFLGVAALVLAAGSVVRQGEWKDSIALWEAERDRDGTVVAARINLAGAYGAVGRWDEALEETETIARMAPDRQRNTADLFLAHAARNGMEPGIASQMFGILRDDPDPETLLRVAGTALREGQPAASLVAAEAAIRADDRAEARVLAAKAANGAGKPELGLEHAEHALRLEPSLEDAVINRARALLALKRYDEALKVSRATLETPRKRGLLGLIQAAALEEMGNHEEAKSLLRSIRAELEAPPR